MNVNPEKSELAPTREIAAWDPWVRVTHWSLVICVVGSWLTRELEGDWIELHTQLTRIAKVLIDQSCGDEVVRLFLEAAEHALDRMAYGIQHRWAA